MPQYLLTFSTKNSVYSYFFLQTKHFYNETFYYHWFAQFKHFISQKFPIKNTKNILKLQKNKHIFAVMLQQIQTPLLTQKNIKLFVKREDLHQPLPLHPEVSGNKWRKLKYNLIEAQRLNHDTLLTFGGAYSNHIYATAAAGAAYNLKTIGIIRGEETLPLNPTLSFAIAKGMRLHYINRTTYREKNTPQFLEYLKKEFGKCYILPEGGTNQLALKGCAEIMDDVQENYDYVCCACGTGGTLAGIITGLPSHKKALGFSALKGNFLIKEINSLLKTKNFKNWQLITDYHFKGYARFDDNLLNFIKAFHQEHNILLERIYTGKMMYGIFDLIEKDFFKKHTSIVAIHTGGLQAFSNKPK